MRVVSGYRCFPPRLRSPAIHARSHVCNTCVILYYGRVLRITTIKKNPTYVHFVAGTIFSVPISIRYNGENAVYDFALKGDILRKNRVGNSIVGQKKRFVYICSTVVYEKHTCKNKKKPGKRHLYMI